MRITAWYNTQGKLPSVAKVVSLFTVAYCFSFLVGLRPTISAREDLMLLVVECGSVCLRSCGDQIGYEQFKRHQNIYIFYSIC